MLKVESDDYIGYKEEITLARGKNYSKKITLKTAPMPIEIAASAQFIAVKNNEIFYQNPSDKLIYLSKIKFSAGGEIQPESTQAITSSAIENVDNILWSPTRELLLLKRGTDVNLFDFKKYDFVNQQEALFGHYIGDIVWSPDNSRVAYYYAPPSGEKSLIFSDAANKDIFRAANLKNLNINNPYIAFSPDSQWLVIIPRNQNFEENKIFLMNVFTKEVKEINSTGNQKEAIFSSDNQKIIYSTFSSNPNNLIHRDLSVMNLNGSEKKSLGVSAKASDVRYWNNPNKVFLLRTTENSKLELADLLDNTLTDFFFKGQNQTNISEIILSGNNSGAVFVSEDKLYYVKLVGND